MLTALQSFIDKYTNGTREEEVKIFNLALDTYREFGVKNLTFLLNEIENIDDKQVLSELDNVFIGIGISEKRLSGKIQKLISFSDDVLKNEKSIRDMISQLPKYSTDKTLTYRDTATLSMLDDLYTMSKFITELAMSSVYVMSHSKFGKRAEFLQDDKKYFTTLYIVYAGNLTKQIKSIQQSSNEIMSTLDSSLVVNKVSLPLSGFVGNPIYHIRLLLVDFDIYRIRNLEDNQKLFESKITVLKIQREGLSENDTSSSSLLKQIEYYEERINRTELKIKKLSEG